MKTKTNTPKDERVSTKGTGDETHSLTGHEPDDVNSSSSSLSSTVTSEDVVRQIKAATYLLTIQLERLWDLMKELRQLNWKRNEETTGLIQGLLRVQSSKFDKK